VLTAGKPASIFNTAILKEVALLSKLRSRAALAAAPLILIASVAMPMAASGTAQAASCNTTAKFSWSNTCTVSSGAHSNLVVVIQIMTWQLDQQECGPLIAIDGYFGPDTKNAVECWQRAHGLTVDGIVGPQTWASLGNALIYNSASGSYYYYYNEYYVDFRMNGSTGVWAYGGPYAGSQWTTMNTSVPPNPIWVGQCCF
jgi:peptidoglycan hydrolase-like protein with peptidoglycan-binding domain